LLKDIRAGKVTSLPKNDDFTVPIAMGFYNLKAIITKIPKEGIFMKEFSIQAKTYILVTILIGTSLFLRNVLSMDLQNIWMLLILSGLASLALILKIEDASGKLHYNVSFLVYSFTFVLLGLQAAMVVIVISNMVEWAWHKYPWYIQCFNIASYVVVIQMAGSIFEWVNPTSTQMTLTSVLGILIALVSFTFINHLMIGVVIFLARKQSFTESGVFDFLPLMIDFTMLCLGAGTALIWIISPYAIILSLIPLYLMYNTLKMPALERRSISDSKTGLYNARYFSKVLEDELIRAERYDRPLTVIMGDLDMLRNINNTYGHVAGDVVLIGIAGIIKELVREYDIVARFGGEEFSILMPETTSQVAYKRVEVIREKVEMTEFSVATSATPIKASISFGIAERDGTHQSANDLVHNADVALYHAKLSGRNRTSIYNEGSYDVLFNTGEENIPIRAMFSLEERTQLSNLPYKPNAMREKPPAVVPERDDQTKTSQTQGKQAPGQSSKTKEQTSDSSRPKWLVNLYIGSLATISAILFVLLFRWTPNFDWIGLSVFALIVLMTEGFSIEIYVRSTSVSTSAAPMLAGILLFGPVGALVVSLVFATVAKIKHSSPFSRYFFNISNQLLAGLLYTGLISIIGTSFTNWHPVFQFLYCLVSAIIVFLCTSLSIAFAVRLDSGVPIKKFWSEQFSWLAPHYLSMGIIAFAFLYSYQITGLVGVGIILVPLLILRLSQKQYIDRTKTVVNELRQKNTALEESAIEISTLNEELLITLAEVIDMRDPFVLGHAKHVSRYAVAIGTELGMEKEKIEDLRKAALLHDIGKIGVSEAILLKPGKLTADEYAVVKQHPKLGADTISNCHTLQNIVPMVLHHHERFDGQGYPNRLKGEEIPIEARIMALADAVEAMAADRPYRRGLGKMDILKEIQTNAGTQFDPMVVNAFLKVLRKEGESTIVNSALVEHKVLAVQHV
jgi:diguanylate cyclase (GGDEF)-like protein/putative nucleotidyltransferase with HDIG domain